MAEGKLYDYYKDIHPIAKGIIAIGVLGGLGIIGYTVYKKLKAIHDEKDLNKTATIYESEYKKLLNKGEKLSFEDKGVYNTLANEIASDLNGCERLSTEVDVINKIINVVKKPIDWYYLVYTFGIKKIDDCGSFGNSSTTYALPELLKDQLDSSGFYTGIGGGIGSGFTTDTKDLMTKYLGGIGVTF